MPFQENRPRVGLRNPRIRALLSFFAILLIVGALVAPKLTKEKAELQLVVTSNILGDLAQDIIKERGQVISLLRPGVDPHTYQPVPTDLRAIAGAQLVIVHGLGLDSWADRLVESAQGDALVVTATRGVTPRLMEKGQPDPHCWLDPQMAQIYVANIAAALKEVDPAGQTYYEENEQNLIRQLQQLDEWMQKELAQLPKEKRKLVTNHDSFAYFAQRYDFTVIGTIIPSLNPEAEPSARQLSELVEIIEREKVSAIFTEDTLPQALAQTIGMQVGHPVQVIRLYTGSLSAADGPADTYDKMMRFNTSAILAGLGQMKGDTL